jgi:predicted metalloprotease with PDZ domain
MMQRVLVLAGVLMAARVAVAQEAAAPKVNYVLNATDTKSGSVAVEMTIQNLPVDELTVAIPVWRPGSYRLQNYPDRVRDVTATAGGAKLEIEALDKKTWKVKGVGKREVKVAYRLSPSKDECSGDHCFIDGPGTWLYIVDHKEAACTARFTLPDGWKVGSGLSDLGDGIFGARDYDTFADCPTELGKFELHEFKQDGALYQLVVHTPGKWDSEALISSTKKFVKEQARIFGGVPFERYVFIYHWREQGFGGGGLEHLNSTNISMPYRMMQGDGSIAASIASHEFFHLWNVKRIRPFELGPFDYSQAVRSKALWMCEGVTSYYGDLALARSGVWSESRYLDHLGQQISQLQNNARRTKDSVETMSLQAWDGKPLDYYNKGELIGWLLDMKIRAATSGAKGMDDVMRLLWERYVTGPAKAGKGPIGVGYPEDGILKALNEVSGQDFSGFYAKHISGVEELPYKELGDAFGLTIDLKRGTQLASRLAGERVENVPAGSDDEKAGLKPGDKIVQVGGKDVTRNTARTEIGKLKAGEPAVFKVDRGGATVELKLTPVEGGFTTGKVTRKSDATDAQKKLVDGWLRKQDY